MKPLNSLPNQKQEEFTKIFKKFLGRILCLLLEFLPFNDKVINTLDLVQDFSDFGMMIEKVEDFNKYFNIIQEEDLPALRNEIRKLALRRRSKYEDDQQGNTNILKVWDSIERDKNDGCEIKLLINIIAAQALPTSSADVEQSFSSAQLVKTLLRNQLKPESLEAILLIIQEYSGKKINITPAMLNSFEQVKEAFNLRKNPNRTKSQTGTQSTTAEIGIRKEDLENEYEDEEGEWFDVQGFDSHVEEHSVKHALKKTKLNK